MSVSVCGRDRSNRQDVNVRALEHEYFYLFVIKHLM